MGRRHQKKLSLPQFPIRVVGHATHVEETVPNTPQVVNTLLTLRLRKLMKIDVLWNDARLFHPYLVGLNIKGSMQHIQ